MLNFDEIKTKIAEIVGAESKDKVKIGFLTKVYEITFDDEEGALEAIDREKAMKIVSVLADGVVRTIDYIGFNEKSVVVVFHL